VEDSQLGRRKDFLEDLSLFDSRPILRRSLWEMNDQGEKESTMNRIILGLVIALTLMVSQTWAANWVYVHTWHHYDKNASDGIGSKVENYIDADSIVLDEPNGLIYVWLRTKDIYGDNIDYLCFRWKTDEFTSLNHGRLDFFGNVKETWHGPSDGETWKIFYGTANEYALQKALELKGIKYEIHK
jgi:hypothetical protein